MLLAIDTSTRTASLALFDGEYILGEATWRTHENHTRSLMPELVRLMQLAGVTVGALEAIAVATGPGSFTGLRIGLSAAKGVAFGLNAALIGVPTLDIGANAFADQPLPVCAVLQAGRDRFGAAIYAHSKDGMERQTDYFFGAAEPLVTGMQNALRPAGAPVLVVGELDDVLRDELSQRMGSSVYMAHNVANLRRAGYLAALAWKRWRAGQADDLQALSPYYIPTASLA